jgi:hypothetical protein
MSFNLCVYRRETESKYPYMMVYACPDTIKYSFWFYQLLLLHAFREIYSVAEHKHLA